MRFIQFRRRNENVNRLGVVSENGVTLADLSAQTSHPADMIQFIASQPSLADLESQIKSLKWECVEDDIQLMPPVTNPEKIICIGLNYLGHCQEQKKEPPKEPMFFSKFASALTGPTGNVIHHNITSVISAQFAPIVDFPIIRTFIGIGLGGGDGSYNWQRSQMHSG